MSVYSVHVIAHHTEEVEAIDEEFAGDIVRTMIEHDPELLLQGMEFDISLSDCQYSAQDELRDREDSHELQSEETEGVN